MPLYEFQCKDCGTVFEVLVITEKDRSTICCKKCSGVNIQKMPSAASVRSGGPQPLSPSPSPPLSGCGSGGFS